MGIISFFRDLTQDKSASCETAAAVLDITGPDGARAGLSAPVKEQVKAEIADLLNQDHAIQTAIKSRSLGSAGLESEVQRIVDNDTNNLTAESNQRKAGDALEFSAVSFSGSRPEVKQTYSADSIPAVSSQKDAMILRTQSNDASTGSAWDAAQRSAGPKAVHNQLTQVSVLDRLMNWIANLLAKLHRIVTGTEGAKAAHEIRPHIRPLKRNRKGSRSGEIESLEESFEALNEQLSFEEFDDLSSDRYRDDNERRRQ